MQRSWALPASTGCDAAENSPAGVPAHPSAAFSRELFRFCNAPLVHNRPAFRKGTTATLAAAGRLHGPAPPVFRAPLTQAMLENASPSGEGWLPGRASSSGARVCSLLSGLWPQSRCGQEICCRSCGRLMPGKLDSVYEPAWGTRARAGRQAAPACRQIPRGRGHHPWR